ncbi:MAG: Ni/Fe-hydrogenase, b-type cytochrome subunit [Coriobacteriia bacterium]
MAHVTTREEHPWPAIVMHWFHLVSIIVLTYTGFYIHRPFGPGSMDLMRTLHFVFMFVLIFSAIVRVYWAFMGRGSAAQGSRRKIPDYRHFGPQRENKGQAWETAKYYLFLRKTHPLGAKYNALQKATYLFWLVLIVLQAVTGFAIWTNTAEVLLPLTYAVGGLDVMRMIHYLIMWVFIITTAVHVYLSIAEAPWQAPLIFLGRESGPGRTNERPARV